MPTSHPDSFSTSHLVSPAALSAAEWAIVSDLLAAPPPPCDRLVRAVLQARRRVVEAPSLESTAPNS
jgi:hypothetical protein